MKTEQKLQGNSSRLKTKQGP